MQAVASRRNIVTPQCVDGPILAATPRKAYFHRSKVDIFMREASFQASKCSFADKMPQEKYLSFAMLQRVCKALFS